MAKIGGARGRVGWSPVQPAALSIATGWNWVGFKVLPGLSWSVIFTKQKATVTILLSLSHRRKICTSFVRGLLPVNCRNLKTWLVFQRMVLGVR